MRTAREEGACSKPKGRAALCIGLALALAAALAPAAAIAAGSGAAASQESAAVLAQGALGDESSVRWTLAANGNLALSGSGHATASEELFDWGDEVVGIYVGREVESLGSELFSCFSRLETVSFEEGSALSEIGPGAFSSCSRLRRISIPASVQSIGAGAFYCCYGLEQLGLAPNGSLTDIGESAFSSCEKLDGVVLPQSLESIGAYAFNGCSSLQQLRVPAGVRSIGERAFGDCCALETFTLDNPEGTQIACDALAGTPQVPATSEIAIKGVRAAGKGRLKVSWTKVPEASSYKVVFKKKGAKGSRQLKLRGSMRTATLKGLAKGKRYQVQVIAYNQGKSMCLSPARLSPKVR
ncbi:MAG: fibronectin type III domain-containing protein [Coriobacteriales bacterium]